LHKFLKQPKVPLTKFILIIKHFILEVPVNKAYKELYLAYKTTHKMDNRIRQCIFKFGSEDGEFLSGEVEMDESYFGGRRKVKRGERYNFRANLDEILSNVLGGMS
jgi:transposase